MNNTNKNFSRTGRKEHPGTFNDQILSEFKVERPPFYKQLDNLVVEAYSQNKTKPFLPQPIKRNEASRTKIA